MRAGEYVAVSAVGAAPGNRGATPVAERADALALDSSGRDGSAVLVASREFYDRLGIRARPSALFLDGQGVVRGRRIAGVPSNWTILRTVDENTDGEDAAAGVDPATGLQKQGSGRAPARAGATPRTASQSTIRRA